MSKRNAQLNFAEIRTLNCNSTNFQKIREINVCHMPIWLNQRPQTFIFGWDNESFFYLNFIKNNFSAIMLIHSEHLNRKSNSGGKSRNRVFFSNLFINENKLLSFSEFMSFFAEFSHQFFCIQSSTQHSCQNKGENKIDFLVQFW